MLTMQGSSENQLPLSLNLETDTDEKKERSNRRRLLLSLKLRGSPIIESLCKRSRGTLGGVTGV